MKKIVLVLFWGLMINLNSAVALERNEVSCSFTVYGEMPSGENKTLFSEKKTFSMSPDEEAKTYEPIDSGVAGIQFHIELTQYTWEKFGRMVGLGPSTRIQIGDTSNRLMQAMWSERVELSLRHENNDDDNDSFSYVDLFMSCELPVFSKK